MRHLVLGLCSVLIYFSLLAASDVSFADPLDFANQKVLANLDALKALKIKTHAEDPALGVGVAVVSSQQRTEILKFNHEKGRCGGFEILDSENTFVKEDVIENYRALVEKDTQAGFAPSISIAKRTSIENAIDNLSAANLKSTVQWLSTFKTRNSKSTSANLAVSEFHVKLSNLVAAYRFADVSTIEHRQTRQQSLRVRLNGRVRPQEIIVIGGHFDSLNTSWSSTDAPGADDNASGSANLFETLRVLLAQGQPERTVEFFWYAAEESGLVGSSEIAKQYKSSNKDVIAVLQLDMTLHPGSGELTIANITDNTTPWLREAFRQFNGHYIGARLIEDTCGYACSDHASWYRQGYSTLLPFEAATRKMNKRIHSADDKINSQSNFTHSLAFSKLALAFAMELGNSNLRRP